MACTCGIDRGSASELTRSRDEMTLRAVFTGRQRVHLLDAVLPDTYAGGYWTARCGLFGHFTPDDGARRPTCRRCQRESGEVLDEPEYPLKPVERSTIH